MKKEILKKKILYLPLILILFLISVNNVHAIGLTSYNISYGGTTLSSNSYTGSAAGNKHIVLTPYLYSSYTGSYSDYWVRINLCMDSTISSFYIGNYVSSFNYKSSKIRCSYTNSSYTGGRLVQFVYKTTDTFGSDFTIYQSNYASIQLLSVEAFENNPGFTDDTNAINSETIINQNSTIINNQNQINSSLNDINNADISDNDKTLPDDSKYTDYSDTESSLKDKVSQADLNSLSIGIDATSSSWVWDTLTRFIQSNSIIFGMFIAILSIGVIKMALGR